jgi:hypothetical protein
MRVQVSVSALMRKSGRSKLDAGKARDRFEKRDAAVDIGTGTRGSSRSRIVCPCSCRRRSVGRWSCSYLCPSFAFPQKIRGPLFVRFRLPPR